MARASRVEQSFQAAEQFFLTEEWTSEAFALDAVGEPCCATEDRAVAFSIAAAFVRISTDRSATDCMVHVQRAVELEGFVLVADWERAHTKDDVPRILRAAAVLSRQFKKRGRKVIYGDD